MRIFVTGGTGFIGSHFNNVAAKNNNLVRSISELANKKFVINKPKFFRIEDI